MRPRAWHVHLLTIVLSVLVAWHVWTELMREPTLGTAFAIPLLVGLAIVYFGAMLGILLLFVHRITRYGAIVGLAVLSTIIGVAVLRSFDPLVILLLALLLTTLGLAVRETLEDRSRTRSPVRVR